MATLVTLSGTISLADVVTNTLTAQKLLSGAQFTGNVSTVAEAISVGTGGSSIGLPTSPVQFVYIKNTHATQTLTVAWTPNGGSNATVITLETNSCIIFCETTTGGGITALTLTGSGAGTTCEYILAG